MTQNPARESGYDLMRLCAMLAVVAIHVLMVYRVPGAPVSPVSLIDTLLHFAVPVFFFVSGALVWGRYSGTGTAEYASFLKRRAITIAAPYLAWSAIYIAIASFRGDWVYWVTRTPMLVLTGKAWYHLYFVPVLLLFYLLTPIAAPLVRRWPEIAVAAAFLARLTLVQPVTELAAGIGGPMLVTFTATAVTHLSLMVLGAWFARRRALVLPILSAWWPALILLGAALLIGKALSAFEAASLRLLARTAIPFGMAFIVLALAGAAFRMRLSPRHAAVSAELAAYSFGVYFIHPVFVLAWGWVVTATGASHLWSSAWFAVLSVFAITAVSLAVSVLLSRNRFTAWLIGRDAGKRTQDGAMPLGSCQRCD